MTQKEQAEKLYQSGETIAAIAVALGVSRRTIERWANDGAWREKRTNVIPIAQVKPKTTPVQPAASPRPSRRSRPHGNDIDELELVTIALTDVSAMMGGGDIDPRGMGTLATALCRLVELRLKLQPRTAAELAELTIALNISPVEFARELRSAWEKRA